MISLSFFYVIYSLNLRYVMYILCMYVHIDIESFVYLRIHRKKGREGE